jgi:hypothetical protein
MPHIPKVPASCVGLDLALVEQALTKHRANVAAAAKELGVPVSDLRRLTWAKPDLLQTALDEMTVVVARAEGVLIEMLASDDPRRPERAADKILSSWAAQIIRCRPRDVDGETRIEIDIRRRVRRA